MGKCNKRKKNFYLPASKRQRNNKEDLVGSVGYLGSCNNKDDIAVREAYDLLNTFADRLYGPYKPEEEKSTEGQDEKQQADPAVPKEDPTDKKDDQTETKQEKKKEDSDEDSSADEDIDAALTKNIVAAVATRQRKQFRFQAVRCGVASNIYIKARLPDPLPPLTAALEDIRESRKARTRALARLLPVQCVCPAYHKDIEKALTAFCAENDRFAEHKSFYAVVKIKNTNVIDKTAVLGCVLKVMKEVAPHCLPVLLNAHTTLIVTVLRAVCFVSHVPDYDLYRKYNLTQVANEPEPETPNNGKSETAKPEIQKENTVEESKQDGESVKAQVEGNGKVEQEESTAVTSS